MKLKNKKTGEIGTPRVEYQGFYVDTENEYTYYYKSLQRMYEEWKDVTEDTKDFWYIRCGGAVKQNEDSSLEKHHIDKHKEIGNYFSTREEAERAVRKLKAWKRLKDKGFKFELWDYDGGNHQERIRTGRILFRVKDYEENDKDLDLLFGGEE